jgi:NitT/TauT family transport system ATP-binding protein
MIGNVHVGVHIHTSTHDVNPRPVKLSLRGVSKTFSSGSGRVEALGTIDLEIREEEFLCIVGPSGCGKSTLLNLIAGLELPETGEVWCNGSPVTGPGPDRVVIFQEPALFPWLTVLGNVEFGLRLRGDGKARRRERAMDALRMVHLHRFSDAYVHQLSGGMKQRVALARALVMNPEILLMDEPFAALDAQTRDMLHGEVQAIWAETKKTIVFVTHNVREASCLGDRVVLFTARPGRIKREFRVDQPRPRQIEDPGTISLARMVLAELKDEVRKAFKEELGNGDEH